MATRIGINGFGRIGRNVLRAGANNKDIEFVAVNDLPTPISTFAHLLKYDSVHGTFDGEIIAKENSIIVNGNEIKVFTARNPADIPWREQNVDIVIESTGVFTDGEKAAGHLQQGVKKVIISAPAKNEDITIVLGVNESGYDPEKHHVISNASCTTNCVVPIAKLLHENFKIERAFMTTIHSYTNDQNLLDLTHKKDMRRARAAGLSMIPSSTGAAKMVGVVFPELKGRIDGTAIRVPTPNVSIVDLSANVEKDADVAAVNAVFEKAAAGPLKGILQYNTEPLVSKDFNGNPHSCIFDSTMTAVVDKRMIKVFGWYDNEWGYSSRIIDLAVYIANKGLTSEAVKTAAVSA